VFVKQVGVESEREERRSDLMDSEYYIIRQDTKRRLKS